MRLTSYGYVVQVNLLWLKVCDPLQYGREQVGDAFSLETTDDLIV